MQFETGNEFKRFKTTRLKMLRIVTDVNLNIDYRWAKMHKNEFKFYYLHLIYFCLSFNPTQIQNHIENSPN